MNIKEYIKDKNILLHRFYKEPRIILIDNDYFNSKEFFDFLNLIIDDINFIKKLDNDIVNKLLTLDLSDNLKEKVRYNIVVKETLVDNKKMLNKKIFNMLNNNDFDFLAYEKINTNFFEIIDNLFCSNEFLNIIENKLDEIINYKVLSNIYEIICESIKIKEMTSNYDDWIYERISDNKIKEFDLKKANNLILKIFKKLNNKKLRLIVNNKNK